MAAGDNNAGWESSGEPHNLPTMTNLPLLPAPGPSDAEIAERVDNVLTTTTLGEKVGMMSCQGFFRQYKADDMV